MFFLPETSRHGPRRGRQRSDLDGIDLSGVFEHMLRHSEERRLVGREIRTLPDFITASGPRRAIVLLLLRYAAADRRQVDRLTSVGQASLHL